MDLLLTALICVVIMLVIALFSVRSALAPEIPVKGTTNVPGPSDGGRTWPILGDAWRFIGVTNMKEMLEAFERLLLTNRDKAMKLWLGSRLLIFVNDPSTAELILTSSKSNTKDPEFYRAANDMADGVFSRHGNRWTALRRPLNKLMAPSKIINYHDIFEKKSEQFCDLINEKHNQGVFDILTDIMHWSVDVMGGSILKVPVNYLQEPKYDVKTAKSLVEMFLKKAFQIQYRIIWIYYFTGMRGEWNRLKKFGSTIGKWILDERLKILEESELSLEDPEFTPESYADVVIQNIKSENLRGSHANRVITDFIVAGFDTSSISLASACLFLAMHPEYQEKAYKEQTDIMGDSLRAPTREELAKMDYLWMVYQETLRHVGVPGVLRVLSSPLEIEGSTFPEGASIYIGLRSLQMNPKYWEKTKEFYPDNFLPEHVAKRPKGVFMPFITGARNCPGKLFAVNSGKTLLSTLLRRFSFTTPLRFDEMDYNYLLLLESKDIRWNSPEERHSSRNRIKKTVVPSIPTRYNRSHKILIQNFGKGGHVSR